MVPRLFSRGKSRSPAATVAPPRLQWCRGFSAAESRLTLRLPDLDLGCFNGAAAFQPRKGGGRGSRAGPPACFNGAAAFQPRKAPGAVDVSVGSGSFNGAAAFQPRKVHCMIWLARMWICFNGAAAFQPRKVDKRNYAIEEIRAASMVPRLFSRGKTPRTAWY